MADKARAKFFVQKLCQTTYGGSVELNVVTRGEDNKAWSAATPSGQITMTIRNELALEFFKVGDEFFVDFSRAEKGAEGMEATPA